MMALIGCIDVPLCATVFSVMGLFGMLAYELSLCAF